MSRREDREKHKSYDEFDAALRRLLVATTADCDGNARRGLGLVVLHMDFWLAMARVEGMWPDDTNAQFLRVADEMHVLQRVLAGCGTVAEVRKSIAETDVVVSAESIRIHALAVAGKLPQLGSGE